MPMEDFFFSFYVETQWKHASSFHRLRAAACSLPGKDDSSQLGGREWKKSEQGEKEER